MDFNEETATQTVVESFGGTADPRMRQILESMVRHLHGFVRDVEPTLPEWEAAIEFLTAVGHKSDDERQEFILLSDVLGVSMLVETIAARKKADPVERREWDATASTVLGPFHVVASPERASGDLISGEIGKRPCVVRGRVLDQDGSPVAGAKVDVWQAGEDGNYDVQRPDVPNGTYRGLFTTDDEGRFWFRSVVPTHYPIPTDGPVGRLLEVSGRHQYRPAHVHFIIQADGYASLTTHLFVADSPYIDSDAVFAVNSSLLVDFTEVTDETSASELGFPSPYWTTEADFVLRSAHEG
jgi:protocatechuate 3,4-dioxygenase beta subunit